MNSIPSMDRHIQQTNDRLQCIKQVRRGAGRTHINPHTGCSCRLLHVGLMEGNIHKCIIEVKEMLDLCEGFYVVF